MPSSVASRLLTAPAVNRFPSPVFSNDCGSSSNYAAPMILLSVLAMHANMTAMMNACCL
jgi:hypothetical protein